MATGYTAGVQDGTITEFKEFAAQCAHAFGALIKFRDKGMSKELPQDVKFSSYHSREIVRAKDRLRELVNMTEEDKEKAVERSYAEALESWERSEEEARLTQERYTAMFNEVEKWTPPTVEHEGLKDFMKKQLIDSISHDCDRTGVWHRRPEKQEPDAWFREEVARAAKDFEYHTNKEAEDNKRETERQAWVDALRESLS